MYANRSRQIRYEFANTKELVKTLARLEASSISRPLFANVFADCFYAVHKHKVAVHKLEVANRSFMQPCEP